MHLIICYPPGHDYICRRVGLREHVLYGIAGPYIPVRDSMSLHFLTVHLMVGILREFSLSYQLHYLKAHTRIHPHAYEIDHDVVTGTDGRIYGTGALAYKLLGISQPDVGAVGKPGYAHKVRHIMRLRLQKHLHGKIRSELRHSHGPAGRSSYIVRGYPKRLSIGKQRHYLRRPYRYVHRIEPRKVLKLAHHGRIILSEDIQL